MSRNSVSIDGFSAAIQDLLEEYGDECLEAMQSAAEEVADEAKAELKGASPSRSGKYKKGWAVDTQADRLGTSVTVYNKNAYQLTHLLEHGHVNRAGGRSHPNNAFIAARPHIAEVNDKAQEEFEQRVREKLG